MKYETHIPSNLYVGGGELRKVGEIALKLGIKRALIVSDSFLYKSGLTDTVSDRLKEFAIEAFVFSEIESEPETGNVLDALQVFKFEQCDGVVSIGGGSCIDTAKAVAVLANNNGKISDYIGIGKVPNPGLPHIAIPTTAGTGSEVTRVTIITDPDKNIKMMCLDNSFLPSVAIVDYELTLSMPSQLTSYVGIDALTHAIEAYVSKKSNPVSDLYAKKAIVSISRNILTAYEHPDNRPARANMMEGATFAGIAFSNASVCTVHGMSRPIGAYFHVPHGLSNAMLLPKVTEQSVEGNPSRYAEISQLMGINGNFEKELTNALVAELYRLNSIMQVPSPKEYGIDRQEYLSHLSDMADAAIASGSPGNNPKEFTKEEIIDMYKKVF